MKTLSSAHVHTQFCDGKSTAAEMAATAYAKGFVSLGFSSHATMTYQISGMYEDGYSMPLERVPLYREEIRRLQKEYEGRMTIYLGIERDFYCALDPKEYDYHLAAVHQMPLNDHCFPAVDGSPEEVKKYVDEGCGGDGLLYAKRYYGMLADFVCKEKPPIIAHVDLIRKSNPHLHLWDEEGKAYQSIALEALTAMRESDAILEVNTGAIGRGTLPTPYPSPFLLKRWKELGGKIMLNSDCHNAKMLDVAYEESEELMRSVGFDHAVRLGKDTLWEEYKL